MDIRKPFLQSFTVKELMQFIDYYMEYRETFHVPGHPWEVCDLVARFLGFGYSRQWSEDEIHILKQNYSALGARDVSKLLLLRTAYDCKEKAKDLGLLTDIDLNKGRCRESWNINEIDILLKYYPIIGPKTMILLPGRSEGACMAMARLSGITAHSSAPWSAKEIEILRNTYPELGLAVGDLLPGRSLGSIRSMARKMSVHAPSNEWTAEDDKMIRTHYPQMGPSVANLLGNRHSEAACHQRALSLGACSIQRSVWSESELEILKDYYPLMGSKTAEMLPGRTERACTSMARILRISKNTRDSSAKRRWSHDEIRVMKETYPRLGATGVHELLPDRSLSACFNKAKKLGLTFEKSDKRAVWSADEIEILKNNYPHLGQDVANLLPTKTAAECRVKAGNLGLLTEGYYWTAEEDAVLRKNYPKEGHAVSKRFPYKTKDSCISRIRKLGLHRIKAVDTAVDTAVVHDRKIPDGDLIDVESEPGGEDLTFVETVEENTASELTDTPQDDDIVEGPQEENFFPRFGGMRM